MTSFLRSLSAEQQVSLLFVVLFGLLTLASGAAVLLSLRERRQSEVDESALSEKAREAWLAWFDTTPDTPCIAICSTSQGDDLCKGCGRSFDEVQHWTAMSPVEKRAVWRRITIEGSSWRFNRYAERAIE